MGGIPLPLQFPLLNVVRGLSGSEGEGTACKVVPSLGREDTEAQRQKYLAWVTALVCGRGGLGPRLR